MRSLETSHKILLIVLSGCLFVISCKQAVSHIETPKEISPPVIDTLVAESDTANLETTGTDTKEMPVGFTDLKELDKSFVIEIPYATEDNFTKEKLYPCSKCILLSKVADQLLLVNQDLKTYGYQLKMLDCYRPQSIQKKLWQKNPDTRFVMSPAKGSGHGRGTAIDVTLLTLDGKELDMGSAYDEFSNKAYYAGNDVSQSSRRLRWILKKTMRAHGFNPIRTEWWHFQYGLRRSYPVQDFNWSCE